MKGKIIITDKVYFEPDGLPKALLEAFKERLTVDDKIIKFKRRSWEYAMKAYEASRQKVEVENETYPVIIKDNEYWILLEKNWNICKDSQPCEVEIKGKKAIIISLTKE